MAKEDPPVQEVAVPTQPQVDAGGISKIVPVLDRTYGIVLMSRIEQVCEPSYPLYEVIGNCDKFASLSLSVTQAWDLAEELNKWRFTLAEGNYKRGIDEAIVDIVAAAVRAQEKDGIGAIIRIEHDRPAAQETIRVSSIPPVAVMEGIAAHAARTDNCTLFREAQIFTESVREEILKGAGF